MTHFAIAGVQMPRRCSGQFKGVATAPAATELPAEAKWMKMF